VERLVSQPSKVHHNYQGGLLSAAALLVLQSGKPRHNYYNVSYPEDRSVFQAVLFMPGRGKVVVGQHSQQIVAACIADAAAQMAHDAGLDQQQHSNFAPMIRQMVS
jgi:hypothetical protein